MVYCHRQIAKYVSLGQAALKNEDQMYINSNAMQVFFFT